MGRHRNSPAHTKTVWRRLIGILKITILCILVLMISGAVFAFSYLMGLDEWKEFDPKRIAEMQQTLLIYDSKGIETAALYNQQNRVYLPIEKIPGYVKNAFIAIEDSRFYEHKGVDIIRIIGAFIVDIKSGSIEQGASTITQQLVKLTSLTGVQTISRKLQEAVMAYKLEQAYTKDEILEMYLNYIYFGNGAYGIEAAAKVYFGVSAESLTLAQGALLAGVIKGPTHYAPHLNLDKSVKRRNLVLEEMFKQGYITEKEKKLAKSEPVVLIEKPPTQFGYFIDMVLGEAEGILSLDSEELLSGGYRIYTTMDLGIQKQLERFYEDDAAFPPSAADGDLCQSAFCVLDSVTSEIRAIVGGRKYETRRGLNRGTDIRRQPGSAIKPVIVYAPAIEKLGYAPTTLVLDEKEDFNGYVPKNFSDNYAGWVTMREALSKSLNLPAVRIFEKLGIQAGKVYASSVGIPFEKQDVGLTLALGGFTTGVSPLTLCNSFTPFANGGYYSIPSCIIRIDDGKGKTIYERPVTKVSVLSNETAFLITSMLQSAAESGTARRVSTEGVQIAAKTGTSGSAATEGNKDAWTVAYNPAYTMCCWMGFDSTDEAHSLPSDATGGTYPAELIKRMFTALYKESEAPQFTQPVSIVEARIDLKTLENGGEPMLASVFTPDEDTTLEYFLEDKVPKVYTDYWAVPEPPDDLRVMNGSGGYPHISFTPKHGYIIYQLMRSDLDEKKSVLIEEFEGSSDGIEIIDYSAQYGHWYEYYIVPIHPQIEIKGERLRGPHSYSVDIEVLAEEAYMP